MRRKRGIKRQSQPACDCLWDSFLFFFSFFSPSFSLSLSLSLCLFLLLPSSIRIIWFCRSQNSKMQQLQFRRRRVRAKRRRGRRRRRRVRDARTSVHSRITWISSFSLPWLILQEFFVEREGKKILLPRHCSERVYCSWKLEQLKFEVRTFSTIATTGTFACSFSNSLFLSFPFNIRSNFTFKQPSFDLLHNFFCFFFSPLLSTFWFDSL